MNRAPSALFAIVLVCFLLPWLSISCAGETVVRGAGSDVLLGSMDYMPDSVLGEELDLAMDEVAEEGQTWELWLLRLGALAVLLAALVGYVRCLGAAPERLLSSARWLGGLIAVFSGIVVVLSPTWIERQIRGSSSGEAEEGLLDLDALVAGFAAEQIQLRIELGLWITLACAIALVAYSFAAERMGWLDPPRRQR